MNSRDYTRREAMGVCLRADEDRVEEMRQERMWQKRRIRNLSCTGPEFCGAEDCPRCRPGSYRFATEEVDGEKGR